MTPVSGLTHSIEKKLAQVELSAVGSENRPSANDSIIPLSDGSADQIEITSTSDVSITQTGRPAISDYAVNIASLATSQVLASPGFTSSSTVVGTGTLTFEIGTPTYASGASGAYSAFSADGTKTASVVIDSSNNTLSGIRDAVNASDAGVTASLVLDGNQTRLLFTADDSGAKRFPLRQMMMTKAMRMVIIYLGWLQSYRRFSNLTEVRASQDAGFSLNGLSLGSSSNTIAGLVDGLDFKLNNVTTSAVTVSVKATPQP